MTFPEIKSLTVRAHRETGHFIPRPVPDLKSRTGLRGRPRLLDAHVVLDRLHAADRTRNLDSLVDGGL
ncbi:MAG: hypothetical protein WCF11_06375, partial [Azonexus sp.]